jgi:P-type Cu+ transporter
MQTTVEIPVQGMDCAECTLHVQKAIAALPGVYGVEVFLATEKAVVELDPQISRPETQSRKLCRRLATRSALLGKEPDRGFQASEYTRPILTLFGAIFGFVLFVVVAGEWLGLISTVTEAGTLARHAGAGFGWRLPDLQNVIRAALQRSGTGAYPDDGGSPGSHSSLESGLLRL